LTVEPPYVFFNQELRVIMTKLFKVHQHNYAMIEFCFNIIPVFDNLLLFLGYGCQYLCSYPCMFPYYRLYQ